jgi:hypothetical protein
MSVERAISHTPAIPVSIQLPTKLVGYYDQAAKPSLVLATGESIKKVKVYARLASKLFLLTVCSLSFVVDAFQLRQCKFGLKQVTWNTYLSQVRFTFVSSSTVLQQLD